MTQLRAPAGESPYASVVGYTRGSPPVGATTSFPLVTDLWRSNGAHDWHDALARYWDLATAPNRELEQRLDALDLDRFRRMDARGWYRFLRDEYAPTKEYRRIVRSLSPFVEAPGVEALDRCRKRLLALDPSDIRMALNAALTIPGLGIVGASGLLSLMYPSEFGLVDEFVVKALREIDGLPEAAALARINIRRLIVRDGVILIGILRRKATQLSRELDEVWTARMIGKALWAVGRELR
jgi:hypothetical protein